MIHNPKHWLDYLQALGSLTIGISTLIFSIIIFKRVSFKKNVLERQFSIVAELIDILQDIEIVLETKNKDLEMETGICVPFFNMGSSKDRFKNFLDAKMYFTRNYYENLPFLRYSRHPFLPIRIASSIDKFRITFPGPEDSEKYNKTLVIDFKRISAEKTKNRSLIYSEYDDICKDFETFYKTCVELDMEIQNWLKRYHVKDLNLR
jgi:hypothetical protein